MFGLWQAQIWWTIHTAEEEVEDVKIVFRLMPLLVAVVGSAVEGTISLLFMPFQLPHQLWIVLIKCKAVFSTLLVFF